MDYTKMMPGQTPYTEKERAQLSDLLAHALDAEELCSEDELERFAEEQRKAKK